MLMKGIFVMTKMKLLQNKIMNNNLILSYLTLIFCFTAKGKMTESFTAKRVINVRKNDNISNQDTLIGVLVWKTNSKNINSFLFNENHEKELSFNSLEEFGLLKLHPFQYSTDYEILIFRVVGMDKIFFQVCVSETKNEIKYINRNDRNFNFQSWEENILTSFAIDFDSNDNPPYQSIDSKIINQYSKNEFYHPLYIQDDWLCIENDEGQQSFIKWRTNGKLLIKIFYTA